MSIQIVNCAAENPNNIFIACGVLDQNEEKHKQIVEHIRTVVDWSKVFSMISTYQHLYNERLVRMLKSHLICKSIEAYSNKELVFVDEIGFDFRCAKTGLKIEFKHGSNIFQSDKSIFTKRIKIDNTNNKSSFEKEYEKTFDYLIIADVNKIGIVSYEDVMPFITNDGDGRSAVIEKSKIVILKESHKKSLKKPIYIDDEFQKCIEKILKKFDSLYVRSK